MSLLEGDQTTLRGLEDEIKALKKKIHDYKSVLSVEDIRNNAEHRAYLNPLNTRLAGLEAERRELRTKASSPPQGK
jgi:hypothetical protein